MARGKHRPEKAYRNLEFLTSREARVIRILSEYVEPMSRFRHFQVRDTVVFFGSARTLPPERAVEEVEQARSALAAAADQTTGLKDALDRAERNVLMSRYYRDASELARRLTEWSKGLQNSQRRFIICSGAGPGIMEAANRGASEAAGLNVGLGISLPEEPSINPYVSHELAFEFHYFFMRKFWFAYLAKAMVIFPGGFGTMDELFEILTLVQTGKSQKKIPIVLYGLEYWNDVLHMDRMARWGTISSSDPDLVRRCDDVDSAFEYLTTEITRVFLDSDEGDEASDETVPGDGEPDFVRR